MSRLAAFVGHSFSEADKEVVRQFLDFFDRVGKMNIGFSWEHAENAEPNVLSEKVLRLVKDKNVFVGICTGKEHVIQPGQLRSGFFHRTVLVGKRDDYETKTSDWIIQEIGLAIGKDMSVVLLVEDGVRDPGGLQGDLEYIPFDRKEPSRCFNKLLDMLTALTPRKRVDETVPHEEKAGSDLKKREKEEIPTAAEIGKDWSNDDYERELFRAINVADSVREDKILNAYASSDHGKTSEAKATFEALGLHFKRALGQGTHLKELAALSEQYPENGWIQYFLGKAYEEYKEYGKAADQFEKSASRLLKEERWLKWVCDAAIARSKSGSKNGEQWLLDQVTGVLKDIPNAYVTVLGALKEISEIMAEEDKLLAYSEGLLDLQPDDHALRFVLAHKYSQLNQNALALFHYSLIPHGMRDAGDWNNIGVAYSSLDLNGKAVSAYRDSEAIGGTLAMSNLAHKLIEAGFLEEADEICEKAIKIPDYDKQIGTAISGVKSTREKEGEKEDSILKSVEVRKRFYVEFGRACLKLPIADTKTTWHDIHCPLAIEIRGGVFAAIGTFEKEAISASALLTGLIQTSSPKITKTVVRYEGTVTGQGVVFKRTLSKEGASYSVLSGPETREGLLIINDDMKNANVYLKGDSDTEKFYELKILP
jgi:tetratricopeptide (TPR) repeat protein